MRKLMLSVMILTGSLLFGCSNAEYEENARLDNERIMFDREQRELAGEVTYINLPFEFDYVKKVSFTYSDEEDTSTFYIEGNFYFDDSFVGLYKDLELESLEDRATELTEYLENKGLSNPTVVLKVNGGMSNEFKPIGEYTLDKGLIEY